VYFVPVTFGGVAVGLGEALVFVGEGFGIGACFFRCLAVGAGFGFGVCVDGDVESGGRAASRLIVLPRDSCRDELAIDESNLT
jgi:hypothetical protein